MDYQAPQTQLQAPMSLEAEQALLGAILLEPKAYLSVASFLAADDFFLKRHEYIWTAFNRLQERNDAIDYVTLSRELQDMSVLDDIGGQAYLTNLVNNTPTAVHAEVYGEMVARTATRRKMMTAADTIRQMALDEELPIDKVISEAEQALFAVSNSQIKREFVPIWDAVSEYYDEIEKLLEVGTGTVGLPTGFKALDGLLGGFQKSDLVVFAGTSRHGQDELDADGRTECGAARRSCGDLHHGDGRRTVGATPDLYGDRYQNSAIAHRHDQRARAYTPYRSDSGAFRICLSSLTIRRQSARSRCARNAVDCSMNTAWISSWSITCS